MLESEVAETLMSLSAPDERKFASPLYAHARDGAALPWHHGSENKKRSFQSFTHVALGSSLPTHASSASYLDDYASLQRKIHERPLTSMIPAKHRRRDAPDDDEDDDDEEEDDDDIVGDHDNDSSDVDMGGGTQDSHSDASSDGRTRRAWQGVGFRSPFDGLVAAAASNQDDHDDDFFTHARSAPTSASRPISIPSKRDPFGAAHFPHGTPPMRPPSHSHSHSDHHRHGLPIPPRSGHSHSHSYGSGSGSHKKWSLSRVKEDASFIGQDSSPTGVEDDRAWFDEYRQTDEYRQRARLASVCSSDGSISEYGGFGRKHLEEFIRMEISAANENEQPSNQMMDEEDDHSVPFGSPPVRDGEAKYIGSYSPEARRKRIERFLEKRKHRVWSKKVDYDVRKNFANSRLRVKGRFVKKEDEELLCQLMSFT